MASSGRSPDLSSLLGVGGTGRLSPPGLPGCCCPSMPGLWSSLHSSVPMAGICSAWKTKGARSSSNLEPEIIQNSKWMLASFHPACHSAWVEPHELVQLPAVAAAVGRVKGHATARTALWEVPEARPPRLPQPLPVSVNTFYYSMLYPLLYLPIVWLLSHSGQSWVVATETIGPTKLKLNFLQSGSFLLTLFMNLGSQVGFCFWYPEDGTSLPFT